MSVTSDPRILIVDDEVAQMRALCDTLQDHNYETIGATTGEAALAILREQRFDLILTDLMLPETDGIAVLKAALEIDPEIVGIIMTGEGTIATAVEAMKTGALDYILKPFKVSMILPVLSRAVAVRRLRSENAELTRRLLERTAELEAANKDLEAFSSSVSHDLRGPLRAINGFSAILLEDHGGELSSAGRQLVTTVINTAKEMNKLIDDLLRLSRLGRQPLSKAPVDMEMLVGEVLGELHIERADRQVDIKVAELPDCVADRALLKQVFTNLLSNALKFTRNRERALIEIGCEPEQTYFVRDNGAGFDMKNAHRVFGAFQRLHSQNEFEGAGVGLSIVHRIIVRHGGRIWAEASVDVGAKFSFTLNENTDR
ncbi:MAG TPA: response regulator [Pyrinomonadaceae bacterium]|jgi:hypothetical protein|nr:response regulator [Pyrinomonadaceae bacterium]